MPPFQSWLWAALKRRFFCFILFTPIKIIIFPFDALGPRGGPYFLPLQKVGKDRRKGVSPPCESPDQSGVLDAPLWKPPSLAALSGLAELLAACAAGASVPLGKAASACALATIAAPPPLRFWGLRPLAPQGSPLGNVCLSCAFEGFAPLPPQGSPLGNVCRSCAPAHGTAFETAFAAKPSQISRKLLPRSG